MDLPVHGKQPHLCNLFHWYDLIHLLYKSHYCSNCLPSHFIKGTFQLVAGKNPEGIDGQVLPWAFTSFYSVDHTSCYLIECLRCAKGPLSQENEILLQFRSLSIMVQSNWATINGTVPQLILLVTIIKWHIVVVCT